MYDQNMVLGKMFCLKQDVLYEAKCAVKQNVLFKTRCILCVLLIKMHFYDQNVVFKQNVMFKTKCVFMTKMWC